MDKKTWVLTTLTYGEYDTYVTVDIVKATVDDMRNHIKGLANDYLYEMRNQDDEYDDEDGQEDEEACEADDPEYNEKEMAFSLYVCPENGLNWCQFDAQEIRHIEHTTI